MKNKNHLNEGIWDDLSGQSKKFTELPIIKSLTSLFSDDQASLDAEDKKEGGILDKIKDLVRDLTTERIPLKDALAANPRKRALIVGSSQAGVMGPVLMGMLETKGFVDFKFIPEASKTMSVIYSMTQGVLSDKSKYDIVIVYPGYKRGEDVESVINLINLFEPARCFVVIPPPVTTITDTFKASRLGLNKGKSVPPDYWFLLGKGEYAANREDYCEKLKNDVQKAGATAIDPRDVVSGGELQQTGVAYPNMSDGIHPSDEVAKIISSAVVDAIFESDLTVPAGDVIKKIKPEDLERDSSIVSSLAQYPATSAVLGAAMGRITSRMGMRDHPVTGGKKYHQGIDIAVPMGTPVKAVLDGVVNYIGFNHPKAGNYIDIKHPNGDLTRYLHLSDVQVEKGQEVSKGDVIGLSGGKPGTYGAGTSTGPHLHWETWHGEYKTGDLLDPLEWLASNTDAIKPVNFA